MKELTGRIRTKLDINLRVQSDYALEINDLLLKIEVENERRDQLDIHLREQDKVEVHLREQITELESRVKELQSKIDEQPIIEEEED